MLQYPSSFALHLCLARSLCIECIHYHFHSHPCERSAVTHLFLCEQENSVLAIWLSRYTPLCPKTQR